MDLLILATTAFLLGIRHGLDFDHIAAMLDMAGTAASNDRDPSQSKGSLIDTMKLPLQYILGHALMLAVLGSLALLFGTLIPDWLDKIMERIVGFTLLLLSGYLIYSLFNFAARGDEFKLRSRWMLLLNLIANIWSFLTGRLAGKSSHSHKQFNFCWNKKGAFVLGMLHGFGAETATQILLLVSLSGCSNSFQGFYTLLAFTLGMASSTIATGFVLSAGLARSRYFKSVLITVGALAALFSFVVGLYFLAGAGARLPAFA